MILIDVRSQEMLARQWSAPSLLSFIISAT